jgi:hypothetical protein
VTRTAIIFAKAFILVIALAGLFLQAVLLPIQASQSADQFPELIFLQAPILALCILAVTCGQVVLGCVWVLLSLVSRDAIFSERAFRFVDIMVGALVAASATLITVLVTIGLAANAGPPGIVIPGAGLALCCAALALVLVVMRGLLVKATEQARYLAEVV